jgi:signal transduction histidine kinase
MTDHSQHQDRRVHSQASLPADFRLLLPYIAALELEVDSLRRRHQLLRQETQAALKQIRQHCAAAPSAADGVVAVAEGLAGVLRDLQDPPGYHPSLDQVVAIAVRPLAEQVFRWQQRLHAAPEASLRLELQSEHVEWFPARLRHLLDILLSNALKYRDADKAESWVRLGLRASADGYEFRVSDNGLGMPQADRDGRLDLFYRARLQPAAGMGVGLAVVKLLVEQSGGSLEIDSGEGQGTTVVAVLPRYDVSDFLL